MCEWCGHNHAIDALCDRRPKWSRRGFLAMLGAGVAGAFVAAKLPDSLFAAIPQSGTIGTYGAINRATFSFWRNQAAPFPANLDSLRAAMWNVYEGMTIPSQTEPVVIAANPQVLAAYRKLLA